MRPTPLCLMRHISATTAALLLLSLPLGAAPGTPPPTGLRENTPTAQILKGARIVTAPGQVIEAGTIVIRDGVITAIGADVAAPPDARVWDLSGKTIYPGFIDAYAELPADASAGGRPGSGALYWNSNVAAQVRADELYSSDAELNKKLRSQGITARLVVPAAGIVKGTSALVNAEDAGGQRSILKPQVALHLKLAPAHGGRGEYPSSPMGALTLVRQAFYDAAWHAQACECYGRQAGLPRPEHNATLAALQRYAGGAAPVVIDAPDELYFLRAQQVAAEFGLDLIVRGSGLEYRRLEAVKATGRPVIVPLNFSKAPNVATPEAALAQPLERLLHWDLGPENPARLDAAGVKISFTTAGLDDVGSFLAAVRKAVERGLSRDSALRALTLAPAELFGVGDRIGTLAAGKAANLVVTDGDLFDKKTRLLETWIDGGRHELVTEPLADLRGTWEVQVAKPDGGTETLVMQLDGEPNKLSGKIQRGDKQAPLLHATLSEAQFGAAFKAEPLEWPGTIQLSATISTGPAPAGESADAAGPEPVQATPPQPVEISWLGYVVWADGNRSSCTAKRTAAHNPNQAAQPPADGPAGEGQVAEGQAAAGQQPPAPQPALYPVNYPLGAFGVAGPLPQPAAVLFTHATVWTSGPEGILEDASVLVQAGKIAAVGRDLQAPADALVIDASGKHISPGIIDCHSHIATDGGVNESGQTITAEVRIGDFIDPDDLNIYRQLAGGVTCANILHGSANTIGGQNQVIKFRWGALPDEMKFAGAPPGIKFALGENVKQSNWGDNFTSRYPQTRMGVEQLVCDAFQAARDYQRRWDEWRKDQTGLPPRKDLELEALVEVVTGQRRIHCHSYRQDEILAFLRTCEQFGVRVATLQHILEGYKLADVIAKHGAGGSSFSDWWAYKFEVYDAIPYNGALMHRAGVVVSFNSDDAELARRLNLEAAKAVKYGGVPPHEALKFVTLNPARQLGIDQTVGSLEPGKDADLVVWSGSPLSTYSRCEQTWIDGRKYFDLEDDLRRRQEAAAMRAALVQRVLASGEPTESPGELKQQQWAREDVFCIHGHDDE